MQSQQLFDAPFVASSQVRAMKRAFTMLGIVALILLIIAAVERLASPRICERCGARMQPFRPGDPEWSGSPILECTRCDWMIDTNRVKD